MTMGELIKTLRKEHGYSQEELGNLVGVNRAAVNKWELGRVENIKRPTILKLSEVLGVSPVELMCFDEDIKKEDPPSSEPSPVKQQLWNQILQLDDSTAAKLLELSNLYLMHQDKKPDIPGQS